MGREMGVAAAVKAAAAAVVVCILFSFVFHLNRFF